MENICLERVDKLVGISGVFIRLKQLCDPTQFFINVTACAFSALVLPMRRDTELRFLVHLSCSYLYLKRNTAATDYGRMERTVKVRLGRGNIVFKSSGH